MPRLAPEFLMVTLSVVYLAAEWRLRRRSGWREGALDHADKGVVLAPLVIFLVGALLMSTGGWDLLRIPGVLTVLGLPIALGAAYRSVGRADPDRRDWRPTAVAAALSLLGLVVLWASEG